MTALLNLLTEYTLSSARIKWGPHLNRLSDLSFLGNFRLFEPLAASSKISVKKMTIKRRTAVKLGCAFFLPTFTLHKQRKVGHSQ